MENQIKKEINKQDLCPICNQRAISGKNWTCKACAKNKSITPKKYNALLIEHFRRTQKDLSSQIT